MPSGCSTWKPTPIPPKEQFSRDSLKATQPGFQARVDTLRLIDSTATRQARQSAAAARSALRTADSLRQVAIAAQRHAEAATDSAAMIAALRETATGFDAEAKRIRVGYDSLAKAYSAESTAHVAAELRANELGTRLLATSDLNDRLAKDLQRASPPCHIAHFFGCPSRKVAFVSGVVVASAGAYVVTHRSQFAGVIP